VPGTSTSSCDPFIGLARGICGEQFLEKINDEIGLSYERGVARLPLVHVAAARGHLPLQDRVDAEPVKSNETV
jgi:hypothetical protein